MYSAYVDHMLRTLREGPKTVTELHQVLFVTDEEVHAICNMAMAQGYDVQLKHTQRGLEYSLGDNKWRTALLSLTPGGSEYVDSPEYCAKWIKEAWMTTPQRLMRQQEHIDILLRAGKQLYDLILEECGYIRAEHMVEWEQARKGAEDDVS